MRVMSVQDFLQVLRKSSLLSDAQLDEIWKWPEDDSKSFTGRLVEDGLLTAWQAQQLLAGKTGKSHFFLGKYKLLDLIGVGGMGSIYRAVQPSIGRVVALKVMSRNILKDPRAVTRFLREIRSAAAVDHPNVVRAFDADCDGDTYFLVMEYVAGKDLKSWIRREKSLPVGWSCECIRQAALGLEHAFELGMVHRDIKPSNLLVTQGEGDKLPLVKVLDLGLARFASETAEDGDLTRAGQVLGTPDYIAPEQARNTKTADIRADIFSLGCTLFELVAGRLPFPGTTVMEKLMARASEDAPPVGSFRADIPAGLDAVVAKMLARDPSARYATPAEVAQALAPFAIGTAGTTDLPASKPHIPANAVAMLATQADATASVFRIDVDGFDGMHPALKAARDSMPGQARWLQVTAATVAAALIFVLAWSMMPGRASARRKISSTAAAGKPPDHSTKQKPGTTDDLDEQGDTAEQDSPNDADRITALWVLNLSGRLEIEPRSPSTGNPSKDVSFKSLERSHQRREISSVAELPDGKFNVTGVALHDGIKLAGTDLGRLAKLPHIKRLDLAGARLQDKDLKPLMDMPQLVALNIAGTDIVGPGLQNLKKLTNLKELDLSGLPLRKGALRFIGGLETVQVLRLARLQVNDDDLRLLSGMTSLKELVLASTQVKGDGLKQLTWMAELERLDLEETRVGDAGLGSLKELLALKSLNLRKTSVSDAGAKQLQDLKRLEAVDLSGTKVTRAGVAALQKALQNCKVEY